MIRRAITAVLLSNWLNAAEPSGTARADAARPEYFPHRIWAACDFEGQTPDYQWFGVTETNQIPMYAGNFRALAAAPGPYNKVSATMAGMNPVPGPRMGKINQLYLRYWVDGGRTATFQHFNLTCEDNWHIDVTDLQQRRWSEITLNFTRDARRNDGSAERFAEGDRMDDFKVLVGQPGSAAKYRLCLDDIIFFATDPDLPPEPEPFPNRVIYLAAFDTGSKEKYWPGDFDLAEQPPSGAYWRAARAIPAKNGKGQLVRLEIKPPRPIGANTRLRFRYYLRGTSEMTVQLFDATVQDNRHVRLSKLKGGTWETQYIDFSRDSQRNDGTRPSPFSAGNKVDDLFFLLDGNGEAKEQLFVDEVLLYDGR
jgi:hypothetical protein